jgi:hypothetical protein
MPTTEIIFMWSNRGVAVASIALAILVAGMRDALAENVCPSRSGHPLRLVDVFDGSPEEQATLVPDKAGKVSGYWQLDYVYDAGRFVTIRCKYADHESVDIKLSRKVDRCDYRFDNKKALSLSCK